MKAGDEVWKYVRGRWKKATLVRPYKSGDGVAMAEFRFATDQEMGGVRRCRLEELFPQERLFR